MWEASITFSSSFDRNEGRGAGNVTELLTGAGNSATSRDESIFGDSDDDDRRELGFPNIRNDVGRLEGGAVIFGIGIGIGHCCWGRKDANDSRGSGRQRGRGTLEEMARLADAFVSIST